MGKATAGIETELYSRNLPHYDFRGKVAAVTGGSRGMGKAIAERLANAGATVWILDLEPCGDMPRQLMADVTRPETLAKAAETLIAESGKLDMLVHNAGITGPTAPLVDYAPEVWRRVIEINLLGTYEVCRHFVPLLLKQQRSWLVNMASLAGKEGTPNASAYSAAKAGVIALTKSLAKENAMAGLRANTLAPAAIETELLQQMEQVHVDTMISKSPQGRLGQPEEVAEIVAWMLSDACTFNSGAVFDLSGGRATY